MSIKWKTLEQAIPSKVRVKAKTPHIHIGYKALGEKNRLGEYWPTEKIIWIEPMQKSKDVVCTYLHELIHCISDEYDIRLTEKQVLKLEEALPFILKKGNIFAKK